MILKTEKYRRQTVSKANRKTTKRHRSAAEKDFVTTKKPCVFFYENENSAKKVKTHFSSLTIKMFVQRLA